MGRRHQLSFRSVAWLQYGVWLLLGAMLTAGCTHPAALPQRTGAGPGADSDAATLPGDGGLSSEAASPKLGTPAVAATPAPPLSASRAQQRGDSVLLRFEGREVRAAELGYWFFKSFRREALAAVSKLVGSEIAEREAKRYGIICPNSWLSAEREQILAELRADAESLYGPGTTIKRYVRLRWQQDLDEHLRWRISQARERWLISRVIRYQGLRVDRAQIAILVTKQRSEAEEAAQKLDAGADFARLAARVSVHESAQRGGRMPPLPREAMDTAVARRAFSMQPGERSEVLAIRDDAGHARYEIIRLLRHLPGRGLSWAEAQPEIEAGLERQPVDATEWTAWYLTIEKLYKVRLASNL